MQELSDVYVWGKHYLDITDAKKKTKFGPGKYDLQCTVKTQNVMDLLPSNWIDNFFTPQFVRTPYISYILQQYTYILLRLQFISTKYKKCILIL